MIKSNNLERVDNDDESEQWNSKTLNIDDILSESNRKDFPEESDDYLIYGLTLVH